MVTLTEIDCEDGEGTVEISNNCGPCGGGDLCMADLEVVGCCDGGDNVGYGDLLFETVGGSSEVIHDDHMSFQNGERIIESSELETDWVVRGSTILKTILGLSNGEIGEVVMKPYDVEKVNGFENMGLLLKDIESVGMDVEVQRVTEIVEVIEDDILDDIDAGQGDIERLGFPFNVQIEEDERPPYPILEEIQIYEDEKLIKQIVNAQLQLDEKTRSRVAIMAERHIKWKNMIDHNEALNAKNLELRVARQLVTSMKQQMDYVQSIDNKIKNVMVVADLDSRINKAEQTMEQGTLCSEEEKQFIREIKRLKSFRAILASNMGHPDDIPRMLNQKDQIEELLENLKMDLKTWKNKVSKAQVASITLRRKYVEELEMERELQAQLVTAEESHREAEAHLLSLEEQLSAKNKISYMYQEEPMVTRKSASPTDEPSRVFHDEPSCVFPDEPSCVFPEEPSSEYLDECSLVFPDEPFCVVPDEPSREVPDEPSCVVPDEPSCVVPDEPSCVVPDEPSRVVPDDMDEKIANNLSSTPDEVKFNSDVTNLETEKTVKSVEENRGDDQNKENVLEEFEQNVKSKELIEPDEIIDIEEKEKTHKLMKEEIETELKERIRWEEKVKAIEANERKKQHAHKAQTQAQMLALKEAQKRDNLRLKRLRKRERKRAAKDAAASTTIDDVGIAGSNKRKEIENTNTKGKPPHFLPKQLKPKFTPAVAAAIRNRKPWQHWRNFVISTVMVLILSVFFIVV